MRVKEDQHAPQPKRPLFPTEPSVTQRLSLQQLWAAVPDEQRRRTVQVLSQIVAKQLQAPPDDKEAPYEDR
jgi:hypothetical protein